MVGITLMSNQIPPKFKMPECVDVICLSNERSENKSVQILINKKAIFIEISTKLKYQKWVIVLWATINVYKNVECKRWLIIAINPNCTRWTQQNGFWLHEPFVINDHRLQKKKTTTRDTVNVECSLALTKARNLPIDDPNRVNKAIFFLVIPWV